MGTTQNKNSSDFTGIKPKEVSSSISESSVHKCISNPFTTPHLPADIERPRAASHTSVMHHTLGASYISMNSQSSQSNHEDSSVELARGISQLGVSHLVQGIDLDEIISRVSRHYLERSLQQTGGNKSQAASLLGFSNYQTFSNWLKKYEVAS